MKKYILILITFALPVILLSQENSKSLNFSNNAYVNMGSIDHKFRNQLTVMGWIKWTISPSDGKAHANIVTINSNSSGDVGQFWIQHNSDNKKLEFALQTTSDRKFIWSTTEMKKDEWIHFAATYDGKTQRFFINGVEESNMSRSSSSRNINSFRSNYTLTLGAWAAGNFSRNFDGEIDEISIWKKVLTQEEIRNMMCRKINKNETGLVSYYSMDMINGATLLDEKSNKNGTISGATRNTSTAPIGDESVFSYSDINSLKLDASDHSITHSEYTGQPVGVHIYKVNQIDNPSPIEAAEILGNNYWGVFIVGGENVTFKYLHELKTNTDIIADDLLSMAYRDNALDSWHKQAITKNAENTSAYFYADGTFKHREFLLTKDNPSALPIELLYFNPECGQENGVDIKWSTASEINNDYFTIYRSIDGINWEEITEINGAGNSSAVNSYEYHDLEPTTHDTYYKLRQTDYDGKSKEFDIVAIYCKYNHKEIKIFPNPAIDFINLTFVNEHHMEAPLVIYIYNSSGILVHQQGFFANPNYNDWKIDLPNSLKNGTYFIHVKLGNDYFYTNPFIISR